MRINEFAEKSNMRKNVKWIDGEILTGVYKLDNE